MTKTGRGHGKRGFIAKRVLRRTRPRKACARSSCAFRRFSVWADGAATRRNWARSVRRSRWPTRTSRPTPCAWRRQRCRRQDPSSSWPTAPGALGDRCRWSTGTRRCRSAASSARPRTCRTRWTPCRRRGCPRPSGCCYPCPHCSRRWTRRRRRLQTSCSCGNNMRNVLVMSYKIMSLMELYYMDI